MKNSWEKLMEMLTKYELDFFVVNSRYAIVVKDHLACYELPFVRMRHESLKIGVVRDILRDFENWLEI